MIRRPLSLALDPGYERSAWVVYNTETGGIRAHAIEPNAIVLDHLRKGLSLEVGMVIIEKLASYGMTVGAEVFETVYWSGRFAEAAERHSMAVGRIARLEVKIALCHDSRAKDSNIRQAIIDRYGGKSAIGTKQNPGPLYGIKGDEWAALAVGIAWGERE